MKSCIRFALPWIVSCVIFAPATARLEEKTEPAEAASSQVKEDRPDTNQGTQAELAIPDGKKGSVPGGETNAPGDKALNEGRYTVKTGDTLWDISASHLKDPFLWPLIWKENRSIANPDLIYPGNVLIIPELGPVERALAAEPVKKEEAQEEQQEVQQKTEAAEPVLAKPVKGKPLAKAPVASVEPTMTEAAQPEENIFPSIDKYMMLSAGFISPEMWKDAIIGSAEPKTILGYDDIVYIKAGSEKPVAVGDKFLIYEPVRKVKHPRTRQFIGNLIQVNGILEVISTDEGVAPTARITLSFKDAHIGDQLAPYREPALIRDPVPADGRIIEGDILEVVDKRTINAAMDFVFIDKGSADGVRPGDRFQVISEIVRKGLPEQRIGEVLVFIVKEKTSTALVRKSTNTMAKGNKVFLAVRP